MSSCTRSISIGGGVKIGSLTLALEGHLVLEWSFRRDRCRVILRNLHERFGEICRVCHPMYLWSDGFNGSNMWPTPYRFQGYGILSLRILFRYFRLEYHMFSLVERADILPGHDRTGET